MKKTKRMSTKGKAVLVVAGALLLGGASTGMWHLYNTNKPVPEDGSKSIVIQVEDDYADNYSFEQDYVTDYAFLGDFLESENLVTYTESQYGRYITAVQGYEASDADQTWWKVLVDGSDAETGVDTIPVQDGVTYKFEMTKGW